MLIHNARIVTWGTPNQILNDHAIVLEDGLIKELGPTQEVVAAHPDSEKLDAQGQLLMPGNICAHTHFYGAFARGMAIPGRSPKDFPDILAKLWWPLDKSLTEEDVRYSALVCLVDAIKHGTTTLIDHHASPNAIEGSLDVIAETVDEAGLRGVLCYEVTDRDGVEKSKAGIQENVRFIERCREEEVADGRVAATFGLHASLTVSDETLDTCRAAAPADIGFHLHVAEHPVDEYDSLAKSGMRVVDRLEKHGILGDRTIVVHAVHVDAREIELLADSKTWVTHQPRSNMNNAVGISDVESMMRAGVRVCLGNDGFSNAMWEEWKTAYLVHKVWHRDPRRMSGGKIVEMAIDNNASLAGSFFPEAPIGVIKPGAHADIILVDYNPTTPLNEGNLPWHILFGFHESMVTTTIVAGRLLMHDRQLLTLDEKAISARAQEIVPDVWERYQSFVPDD
ncbi:MAG: putative aminohydrolase SsnA [Anaerolineaceae bacterium]|nr:MAG: putative aminohydrolase SsnA [Anaerolineaceae bacterium]